MSPLKALVGSAAVLGVAIGQLACESDPTAPTPVEVVPTEGLVGFEARLDSLRVELQIPGLAAAIAEDDEIVWARGFGYADVRAGRLATDTTAFYLASVTKPIAAVVIMQLVEGGVLDLDDPISMYGVDLPSSGVIRVRHLLSHTSTGTPGAYFEYDGGRYCELDEVVEGVSGQTLAELLVQRILRPLEMRHTAPSVHDRADFAATGLDPEGFYANMARGYTLSGSEVIPAQHPGIFCAAAGLVSSVRDVAAFSIALSQDRLLRPETKDTMLTRTVSNVGITLPYALGWYVQYYKGLKLEWHSGQWTAQSSLLLRVPERGLTFVAVANTQMLTDPYPVGDGDVMQSAFARMFVDAFVFGDEPFPNGN
jgi:CubicO group peptidase (beta-lactamase class C family)